MVALEVLHPPPGEKGTGVVAVEDLPLAVLLDSDTNSVSVWVLADDQGTAVGLSGLDRVPEDWLAFLWVREGAGGEVAVALNLAWDWDERWKAEGLERPHSRLVTDTVHGTVCDEKAAVLGVVIVVEAELLEDHLVVGSLDLLGRVDTERALCPESDVESFPLVEVLLDGCGNSFVVWLDDLSAVVPVDLVAVVSGRVVRCGNHDTTGAAEEAACEGDVRSWDDHAEEVDLDTLHEEDAGGDFGVVTGAVTCVVADDDTLGLEGLFAKSLECISAVALSGLEDDTWVEASIAWAHPATDSGCAEGWTRNKELLEFGLVIECRLDSFDVLWVGFD